ncbi:hypothetical protein N7478_011175 [Penicillium angulare]|uniref:uncharacterized protein n=1 Tax=Penicillium angulare TaxID=116970 RepID=UPI0025400564|nr:uncharacterized protein N7478_011175 [Penicillium angulare]KAJ5263570.1 hypothetical protein N7478_011175 [Penicillium angulare]
MVFRDQCDRGRPACTQCLNVNSECTGYRNAIDLMFEDETGIVTRKARSHVSKSVSSKRDNNPQALFPAPQLQLLVDPPSVQAISFFTSAYSGGCYLDWLPSIYLSHKRSASLEASFEAVALSYMANQQQRGDLQILAQERYGVGLAQTMSLLTGHQSASPETIASILLLALFAVLSSESYQDAQSTWSKHVHGIVAILEPSSAPAIFDSSAGQSLLHHIISIVQIDCIQRGLPFPPYLKLLYSVSCLNEGYQAYFWILLDRLATLNSQFDEEQVSLSYIVKLEELEKEVEHLISSMPAANPGHFSFQEIPNSHIVNGSILQPFIPVQVFSGWRSAQAWNTLRMIRLYNNNLLRRSITGYLPPNAIPPETVDKLEMLLHHTSVVAYHTAVDMCATVPENLRPEYWSKDPDPDTSLHFSSWARSLIWPLSLAEGSPHGSERLHEYLKRQIGVLGAITGMRGLHKKSTSLPTKDDW